MLCVWELIVCHEQTECGSIYEFCHKSRQLYKAGVFQHERLTMLLCSVFGLCPYTSDCSPLSKPQRVSFYEPVFLHHCLFEQAQSRRRPFPSCAPSVVSLTVDCRHITYRQAVSTFSIMALNYFLNFSERGKVAEVLRMGSEVGGI